jgi:hypothetical protein
MFLVVICFAIAMAVWWAAVHIFTPLRDVLVAHIKSVDDCLRQLTLNDSQQTATLSDIKRMLSDCDCTVKSHNDSGVLKHG